MQPSVPAVRDVVLLGGGHSHVQVLKQWGMRPEPGVRLTLISKELESPYSGMLPGYLSGQYSVDDIHIKLAPLATFAQARHIQAEAIGLDLEGGMVTLQGRPPVQFDVLSINCGAVPIAPYDGATTVKPISEFIPKWQSLVDQITPGETLVIVGAGAGGVELAMAARARLGQEIKIILVGPELLPGHGAQAKSKVQGCFERLQIRHVVGRASPHAGQAVMIEDGTIISADFTLWVTQVQAHAWLKAAGLACDAQGFVTVDRHLRSVSHPRVFAAGDVAHLQGQERAKSGVYAVRAGPTLAENLRRAAKEQPLQTFRAQQQHLALIGDGHAQAIASRAGLASYGRFWWWLKERIDWKFMRAFNELPQMTHEAPDLAPALMADQPEQAMRCGGCGAKLAADPLRRVLQRLPKQTSAQVVMGIGDDAAVLNNPSGSTLLTVDGFRAMIDDPYLCGRIATHHSLNDIFAMAAKPVAGLVHVTLPLMSEALMEADLFQILSGVTDVLNEHGVPLVGGHSAEGAELSLGVVVMGEPSEQVLAKSLAQPDERLILTKPLGTGVILAAAMQGRANASSIEAARQCMDQSNAPAAEILNQHGCNALTDVTGFGFAGHLGEVLRASLCGAIIDIKQLPLLPGAAELIVDVQSSLHTSNSLALDDFELRGGLRMDHPHVQLAADPQTSGGLLASVPASRAEACLSGLRKAGYQAADIGKTQAAAAWVLQ